MCSKKCVLFSFGDVRTKRLPQQRIPYLVLHCFAKRVPLHYFFKPNSSTLAKERALALLTMSKHSSISRDKIEPNDIHSISALLSVNYVSFPNEEASILVQSWEESKLLFSRAIKSLTKFVIIKNTFHYRRFRV